MSATGVLIGLLVGVARASEGPVSSTEPEQSAAKDERAIFIEDVCKRIERAARMWSLPPAFLARLIWQESRFNPNAVSPVGAQGIAQFMPATARFRGLDDPFDPKTAIPASAHYLFDLRNRFGNLGLAAAAYNAGPGRVQRWRSGVSGLPRETRAFVSIITGHSANDWNDGSRPDADYTLQKDQSFQESCRAMPVRTIAPKPQYDSGPRQPWGSHLTADWSPGKAMARYASLQNRFPDILNDQSPMVLRVINPRFGRAPRYEVRIGAPDRSTANQFCKTLKRAGGVCIVLRTN
ncbi:MAG: lytic transglycosylase domain-containing protein [Pseudomonadota bacterium]